MLIHFDESGRSAPAKRRASRTFIGVALFGAMALLGQTFAANIGIGTGGALEFGQGIQVLTSCAGNNPITLKPKSSFANVTGGGTIKFASIDVTGIPSSCIGSKFTFTAFGETSTAALPIFNSNQTSALVMMKSNSTFVTASDASGITITTNSSSSFSIQFANPVINSNFVYRLTVESRPASCSDGINCAIGDTGPGGGTIFMIPTTAGNTTGLTYEIAPVDIAGTSSLCSVVSVAIPLNDNLGWGESNTALLMADSNCNGLAYGPYKSVNYNGEGKNDWFIPSRYESLAARDNVRTSYANWSGTYMTSSAPANNAIWTVDFLTTPNCGGGLWPVCSTYKNSPVNLRPIRTF